MSGIGTITINRNQSGLGRPLAGKDHYSGLLMTLDAVVPAGITLQMSYAFFSVSEAEATGILSTSADPHVRVAHYNISEYFRQNPLGFLVVMFTDVSTANKETLIATMQTLADGQLRQCGFIEHGVDLTTAKVNAIQAVIDTLPQTRKLSVIYGANTDGISLPDLKALSANYVSVVIGQDGGAIGADLFDDLATSIPNVGAVLGVVSKSKVHESIAWVEKFNVASTELDLPALGDGSNINSYSLSALNAISDKGYIFFIKRDEVAGTYINESHTSVATTNDFTYIEANRTMDKAVRGVTSYMTPKLSAPLYLNANGTLQETTIGVFKNEASKALEQMQINGEISQFQVLIDPTQNVASTSTLELTVKIVPVGVARFITVNIGFSLTL